VNEFVEECRREWRRLRVPEPIANEMAADLAADLEEAAAEGASPEDVLGSAAFDARAFAASWAAARGLGEPARSGTRTSGRRATLAAIAVLLAVAVSGALLTAFGSSSDSVIAPVLQTLPQAAAPPTGDWKPVPGARFEAYYVPGKDGVAVGAVLLLVGLGGAAVIAVSWLWLSRRPITYPRAA